MKIEFYSEKKLKKEVSEIMGKYLDLKKFKIFFFGSRVSGKSNKRSDIDIGIKGHREVPFGVMSKIKEDIFNIPTLYHIDVVDFCSADKDFQKIAEKNIEIIK
jgi:predicted nucleotidyltransferase